MAMEYYSFEKVLKELQMEEDELKRLVSEGEIRAFRDEDKMKFRKSDIDGLKKGRMTEPTIILPTGEPDNSAEDSEVLLVEEDTSETLLDIADDLDGSDSGSTAVPAMDSADLEESSSSTSRSKSKPNEIITEELTFEEDTGAYVLDSSDDVLIDSSEELAPVTEFDSGSKSEGDAILDANSDTGLQTEPLDMNAEDLASAAEEDQNEASNLEMLPDEASSRRPRAAKQGVQKVALVEEEPLSTPMMALLVAATILLLVSGMFVVNTINEVDTPSTGWLTDITYEYIAPARHLYQKGQLISSKLDSQMKTRERWRKSSR